MRAFKRWMRSNSIDFSDALSFPITDSSSVSVVSLCALSIGDLVATIPKLACLTVKNSAAREMVEAAGLEGSLALSFAVMYERSLGCGSRWHGYLQLLPEREMVPVAWSPEEVDRFLMGTELHKTVKEDQVFLYEDWKEHIEPLILSDPLNLDANHFGVEQYFSAKSLVSSRSFQVDDYHGYGMVPLADLFNHKTQAENVHFTNSSSQSDDEGDSDITTASDEEDDPKTSEDGPKNSEDDSTTLEMIVVREVEAGAEVFNTYGIMGNAALFHRYGFTEPDNTFDIVNIDLTLVVKWSSSIFSNRHTRARLSLWRRLKFCGCTSQDSEYFEISFHGEPQIELPVLLFIIFLPDASAKLNCIVDSFAEADKTTNLKKLANIGNIKCYKDPDIVEESFLTKDVCNALVDLANIRENMYGPNSLADDTVKMRKCCPTKERKLYNSLVLRVCERKILRRLRAYASKYSKSKKRKG